MTETNEPGRPMRPLGKIDRVAVRGIWPSEALDFTPWLASHLDLLGDALGMELDLVREEAPVGDFSLDILARDLTPNGAMVAIENQLERTDHMHLGQIVTYAAGYDVRTVVWVTPEFRDEHRAAIDWLNNWTLEEIKFFGVEVSAIKIDESLPAPVFRLVAFPNDWTKRAKQGAATIVSPANEKRIQFFQPLIDALRGKGFAASSQVKPFYNQVTKAEAAFKGLKYYPYISEGASVFLDIYGDRERNVRIFESLESEKAQIEKELQASLIWSVGTKGSRISLQRGDSITIDSSPEQLEKARQWMLDTLPNFIDAINPRLERIIGELDSDESAPAPDPEDPDPDA